MEKMKSHRDSLAILGNNWHVYSDAIRNSGFSCCHVREDWIAANCTEQDVAIHQRYVCEYAQEALASDSPADILFDDEHNCRSQWLNELKARRLAQIGPIERILKSIGKRSLIELSPCLGALTKIAESTDRASLKQDSSMTASFIERRDSELKRHSDAISQLAAKLGPSRDEVSLQDFYARCFAEEFETLGARKIPTMQMYGPSEAVCFNFQPELEFVLIPSISSVENLSTQVSSGKVGMGFRLTHSACLYSHEFKKDEYIVVNLHDLLPSRFVDYGRFSSPEELCLNILAWITAMRIILPDVLATLLSCPPCPQARINRVD